MNQQKSCQTDLSPLKIHLLFHPSLLCLFHVSFRKKRENKETKMNKSPTRLHKASNQPSFPKIDPTGK